MHVGPARLGGVTTSRVAEPDELLDAVGVAFSRLRRRTAQPDAGSAGPSKKDLTRNLVINLVDEAEGELTVGGVADKLGVDPSVASRMVSDCIKAGYVERRASQADGRRTVLALTRDGVGLRDAFRRQQRLAFEAITSDWPPHERHEFARLLIKYVASTAPTDP